MKRWEIKKKQKEQAVSENINGAKKLKPKRVKDDNDVESDVILEDDLHEADYYFEGGIESMHSPSFSDIASRELA